jgi:endoglucanase
MTSKGDITGIVGSKPPHILSPEARKKMVELKEMYIDISATSRDEAISWGVKPGDMVVPYFEFIEMKNPNYLLAKAWDNRIGCAVAIEVFKRLQKEKHDNIVYGVGTVQEEVGLRGARTSAYKVRPDIGFSVDVGIAGDTPGVSEKEASGKLGKGPQIIVMDGSIVSHKALTDFVVSVAEECKIPYQFDYIPGGGTDSGAIHTAHEGAPTLPIGIATRYIHSHAGILHKDDFEWTVQLFVEVIKRLDAKKVEQITYDR